MIFSSNFLRLQGIHQRKSLHRGYPLSAWKSGIPVYVINYYMIISIGINYIQILKELMLNVDQLQRNGSLQTTHNSEQINFTQETFANSLISLELFEISLKSQKSFDVSQNFLILLEIFSNPLIPRNLRNPLKCLKSFAIRKKP